MYVLPEISEAFVYILGIFLTSAGLIVLYFVVSKPNLRRRHRKNKQSNKTTELPSEFLEDESYHKALRILDEARIRSLKIVSESKVFDEKTKKDIQSKLEEISQRQLTSIETVSKELLDKYTNLLSTEVETFRETLQEGTISTQQKVDTQVKEDYQAVKKELDDYKAARINQIDKSVFKILAQVMTDIFGKTLSMKEHEELILNLLEDAKERAKFEL